MATRHDDSWLRKISYGGPRIDWDAAWAYYEPARLARRAKDDPAFALLLRVRSPTWGAKRMKTRSE